MEAKRVQTVFFAAIFLALFLVVARVFAPFFSVLLWSSLLYVFFGPIYNKAVAGFDRRTQAGQLLRALVAGLFSIGAVVLIVVPLGFVAVQLAKQVSQLIRDGLALVESNHAMGELRARILPSLDEVSLLLRELSFGAVDLSAEVLKSRVTEILTGGVDVMVRLSTGFVKNVGSFLVGLAFMVFSLFFFFMDGEYLFKLASKAIPIRDDYVSELVKKFRDITRNLFLGYILVAAVQAVAAYVIFLVFRVNGALAFTIVLFFCSFIPMIGAATVWAPLGILKIATGDVGGGILFLALCAFFVSTLDNFLRPFFLKDRINLHPLIIFFSIMGGVAAFGFNGLVLGPMAVILFLTVLDLFLNEHGIGPAA